VHSSNIKPLHIIWLGADVPEPSATESEYLTVCNYPVTPKTVIDHLCVHPYWKRTWVTQEVILAQSLIVLYGPETFAWDCAAQVPHSPSHTFWNIWRDRKARLCEGPSDSLFNKPLVPSLFWLMFEWRFLSQCADPRDRIYGLLVLASDYQGFHVVDYKEDVADLFWRCGEHCCAWVALLTLQTR
jgi:hypothetical protein